MDNKSGGTPNPLSPSPTGGQRTPNTTPETPKPMQQSGSIMSTTEQVGSLDPTGRGMEKTVNTAVASKKPKTGLIVGIIAGCLLLVGGIVAAVIVILNANRLDAVGAAMQKIISGGMSKNLAIDGDINIMVNNESSPIKRINIDLDSDIVIGSMINTSSAVVTFTDSNDKDYSARFDELYASENNLFFKIEGITAALEDSGLIRLLTANGYKTTCEVDENGETNCETPLIETDGCTDGVDCASLGNLETIGNDFGSMLSNTIVSMIEAADGLYLRISSNDFDSLGVDPSSSSKLTCVTDLVSDMDKNSNSAALIYNKYPFVISSTENIPISKKQHPIYQIMIDSENFANYVNEMQNTEISDSLHKCLDWNDQVDVTYEDVEEIVEQMPKVYAEIDSDNNFTRLYLESDISNGEATVTFDLGFSYPTNVTVSEPVEYTDFTEFIQTLVKSMYKTENGAVSDAS